MRRKLVTKTYMREAIDYEIVIICNKENNYYLTIKKYNEVSAPFSTTEHGSTTTNIDNGYFIVEFTPINEYYNGRVYIDNNKNIIGYYFDISRENGLSDKVPFYDDLYLDVIYYPNHNNKIRYDDMDELEDAYQNGDITKEEYELALSSGEKLFKELENRTNPFLNIDVIKIIEKYFD